MPPLITLAIALALITFFIALRITLRDDESAFPGDIIRVTLLSLTSAASLRLAIFFLS